MDNLKLVILENPCLTWSDKLTREFFSNMALLKFRGYQHEYGAKVIPVDEYDFIGTNLLICENIEGQLIPVSGTKIIKNSHCVYYNKKFPPVELVTNGGNNECRKEMIRIIDNLSSQGRDITYDYTWTTLPELRRTPKSSLLKKMITALWAIYHFENKIDDFFVSGTLKVKTDKFFLNIECRPVIKNSFYDLKGINNEKALMMRNGKFTDEIIKDTIKFKPVWDNRKIIGKPLAENRQKAS